VGWIPGHIGALVGTPGRLIGIANPDRPRSERTGVGLMRSPARRIVSGRLNCGIDCRWSGSGRELVEAQVFDVAVEAAGDAEGERGQALGAAQGIAMPLQRSESRGEGA